MISLACGAALAVTACSSPAPERPAAASSSSVPTSVATCEPGGTDGVSFADGGLPALTLACLGDGPAVELGALTGRPTLINLWATWCAPCREEMPLLAQAFRERGDGIRFLGINTQDETGSAADFLTTTGVTYPQAVDSKGELLSSLGLPGLPITLAIDPAGRIIAKQIGQMSPETLAALLQQLADSATSAAPGGSTTPEG